MSRGKIVVVERIPSRKRLKYRDLTIVPSVNDKLIVEKVGISYYKDGTGPDVEGHERETEVYDVDEKAQLLDLIDSTLGGSRHVYVRTDAEDLMKWRYEIGFFNKR